MALCFPGGNMDQAGLWLLVFLGVSGALAQTCLDEKVFVFPKPSENAYVLLKPHLVQPLQQFTVCLKFYTDLTRSFSLFSCASKNHSNDILLFKDSPTKYHLYVGGQYLSYYVPGNTNRGSHWENICMTWNSTTGVIQLWVDGLALPRKGLAKGYTISTHIVMILGQGQDSYGDSFEEQQSFVGEMAEVYMWDTVLPPEQLRRIRRETVPTPLVDWTALNFEIKGYILLEPTLD
ncbi:serum amyloid P-component-like [Eublepharis macularius]|uniref:Pentraxin family member n=1 Tax=Eublepharis macularius TaxID=481883 RepID=A0AA97K4E2_EUBMA|nr:serum amyloid P-component-like [Eublepharis macularius]